MSSTKPKQKKSSDSYGRTSASSGYVSSHTRSKFLSVEFPTHVSQVEDDIEREETLLRRVIIKRKKSGSKRVRTRIVVNVGAEELRNPVFNVFIHGRGSARIKIIKSLEPQLSDSESSTHESELLTSDSED